MSYTATRFTNIYKTEFGQYRLRMSRNGVRVSRNFSRLKDARNYKANLLTANQ